jgi:hypothetical protein
MSKTVHGKVHGKTIQLDEDLGVADGQAVELQVKIVTAKPPPPAMSSGLAAIYAILGERFDIGERDVAERHNEHQPRAGATAVSKNAGR